MYGRWPQGFIRENDIFIDWAELYALTIAVVQWASKLSHRRTVVFCDNQSMVHMVNNQTSHCSKCTVLVILLILQQLEHDSKLNVKYVSTHDNSMADALSHHRWHNS